MADPENLYTKQQNEANNARKHSTGKTLQALHV